MIENDFITMMKSEIFETIINLIFMKISKKWTNLIKKQ